MHFFSQAALVGMTELSLLLQGPAAPSFSLIWTTYFLGTCVVVHPLGSCSFEHAIYILTLVSDFSELRTVQMPAAPSPSSLKESSTPSPLHANLGHSACAIVALFNSCHHQHLGLPCFSRWESKL